MKRFRPGCRNGEKSTEHTVTGQVALCIAAFIELYTAFRIPAEIKKENESGELD